MVHREEDARLEETDILPEDALHMDEEHPELGGGWNYRVVHRVYNANALYEGSEEREIYAVHEVYYDSNNNPTMVTVDACWPQGEDYDELKDDLAHFLKAFDKPVLEYGEIGEMQV